MPTYPDKEPFAVSEHGNPSIHTRCTSCWRFDFWMLLLEGSSAQSAFLGKVVLADLNSTHYCLHFCYHVPWYQTTAVSRAVLSTPNVCLASSGNYAASRPSLYEIIFNSHQQEMTLSTSTSQPFLPPSFGFLMTPLSRCKPSTAGPLS